MQINQIFKKIEWLEKRNNELERRDNYHDGSNTPANGDSLTRKKSRKMRQENYKSTSRKPGGQPGHKHILPRFDCWCSILSSAVRHSDAINFTIKEWSKRPKSKAFEPLVLAVTCQKRWYVKGGYEQSYAVVMPIEHEKRIDLSN